MTFKKVNKNLKLNIFLLIDLINNIDTTLKNKLKYLKIFYIKSKYKNIKKIVKK